MKYNTGKSIDPYIGKASAWEGLQLKWVYRQMRRSGVSRSTARMLVHSAFHIGYRTGIADAP